MFTGIIESLGEIVAVQPLENHVQRISVFTTLGLKDLAQGASVAVNGVCLTVTGKRNAKRRGHKGQVFDADLGPETLAMTTLKDLRETQKVHLEPALRLGDALGGHMVSGHVDGLGSVKVSRAVGQAHELVIEVPATLAASLIPKGSVTISGVSLTVNWVKARRFQVMLIPHTLTMTTLGELCVRSHVNIETDLMAKHVIRVAGLYLEAQNTSRKTIVRGAKNRRTARVQ